MKVLDIAKFLFDLSQNEEGYSMSNLPMQKFLSLSYFWYAGLRNEKLFDENILAWKYGPVVKCVYDEFKKNGENELKEEDFEGAQEIQDENIKNFLKAIWVEYKKYRPEYLIDITHDGDNINETPWKKAFNSVDKIIKYNDIINYYNNEGAKRMLDDDVILDLDENDKIIMLPLSNQTKKALKENIEDYDIFDINNE